MMGIPEKKLPGHSYKYPQNHPELSSCASLPPLAAPDSSTGSS